MEKTDNIDFDELNKFSSRASQWWKNDGDFRTLHQINPIRLNFIKRQFDLENKKVLDVGCGGGILSESLAKAGAQVTAIDASQENIAVAIAHAKQSELSIDYHTSLVEHFAKAQQAQFDAVVCMELLEHVPDPISVICACSSLVRAGGQVFFSTINRNIKAYMLAVLAGEYLLRLLPRGTHQYEKFIRPSELINWCDQQQLKLNDLAGLDYNPILERCSLSSNTDVNYLVSTIKTR